MGSKILISLICLFFLVLTIPNIQAVDEYVFGLNYFNVFEIIPARVTITHPHTGWNYDAVTSFSFTYIETNPDTCWYSLNSGPNITLATCAGTSITVIQGLNTLVVFMNDTSGNLGRDTSSFYVHEPAAQGGGGGGGYFESEVIVDDIVEEVPLGCVEKNLTVFTSMPSWFHITPNITDVSASIWVQNHWEREADLFLERGNNIIKVKLCSETPGMKLGEIELTHAFKLVGLNKTTKNIAISNIKLNVTTKMEREEETSKEDKKEAEEDEPEKGEDWSILWLIILIIVIIIIIVKKKITGAVVSAKKTEALPRPRLLTGLLIIIVAVLCLLQVFSGLNLWLILLTLVIITIFVKKIKTGTIVSDKIETTEEPAEPHPRLLTGLLIIIVAVLCLLQVFSGLNLWLILLTLVIITIFVKKIKTGTLIS